MRLRSLEGLAVAAAVTAGLTLTYGFLESAGFPKLSMFWVWGVMGPVWGAHACSALRVLAMKNLVRELRTEHGWSQGDLADKLEVSRQTDQRHRNRAIRPQPAARIRHREAVRQTDRKDLFSRRNNHDDRRFSRASRSRSPCSRPRFPRRRNSKPARCRSSRYPTRARRSFSYRGSPAAPGPGRRPPSGCEGKYTVYLLTLPGFDGRKPVPGATLESLARDLATLIETRKIDKPVLVGHSLGGTLSLAFAAEHSDLIAGVVAVDGLPVFPGTERHDRRPQRARPAKARAQFAGPDARAVRRVPAATT